MKRIRPVRVLFVVPWDQRVGGVTSVVANLATWLEERNHGAVFLHPGTANELEHGRTKRGFPGYRLRLRSIFVSGRPVRSVLAFCIVLLPTLVRLVGLLRRERIDLVNIHYPLASFLPVVLAARLAGRPVVTSVHGADLFPQGEPQSRYPLGLRIVLRLSHRVVAPSRAYLGQVVGRLPGLRDRAEFIHNGIRLEEFRRPASDREEPSPLDDGGSYVLTIAAHNRKKGLDVLLEAFAGIASRFPEQTLVLVGNGPLTGTLEGLVADLGLNARVRFLGRIGRPETIALLHGCDLFVLSSRAEPFGLAVLEAMACGKPVVATRVGGIREIVRDGVDGLLVEPDDADALAEAMAALLEDSGAARRLGREAAVRARSFDTEANGRAYGALFDDLIG
ncbi:MAG: glycosyltransferase [Gemmatimonadota bacterium]